MLGKTANGLYWMYRYLERAENTARLIATGQRIALTRSGATDDEWEPVLRTSGSATDYFERYEGVTKEDAVDWMLRSRDNPGSVMSALASARQNARLVRTALTLEVWEAMNSCYMRAKTQLARRVNERDLPSVLADLSQSTALVRGTTHGTMLRNDIYNFGRVGTFLERADNTARILDVKYYVLLPSVTSVGTSMDNVQWESILRSVSARGGFRMEYGNSGGPRDIASFLILDQRMPRSLAFCVRKIVKNLEYLGEGYDPVSSCTMAQFLQSGPLSQDIDTIFEEGLHEFLEDIRDKLGQLGQQIENDYRFYE